MDSVPFEQWTEAGSLEAVGAAMAVAAEAVAAEAEEAKVPLAAGRLVGPLPSSRPSASLAWPRRRVAALGGVALGRRHHPVGAAADADRWAVGEALDLAQA